MLLYVLLKKETSLRRQIMFTYVTGNTVYSKYWEPSVTVDMYINPQLIQAYRLFIFHGWEEAFLTSITL